MFDGQTGLAQFAVIARCGVTGFNGAHIQIVCQFKRQAGAVIGNLDVAIAIAEVYGRTRSHVGGSATLGAHIPTTGGGGIHGIQLTFIHCVIWIHAITHTTQGIATEVHITTRNANGLTIA